MLASEAKFNLYLQVPIDLVLLIMQNLVDFHDIDAFRALVHSLLFLQRHLARKNTHGTINDAEVLDSVYATATAYTSGVRAVGSHTHEGLIIYRCVIEAATMLVLRKGGNKG